MQRFAHSSSSSQLVPFLRRHWETGGMVLLATQVPSAQAIPGWQMPRASTAQALAAAWPDQPLHSPSLHVRVWFSALHSL